MSRDIERARTVRRAGWVEVRLHDSDIGTDCARAVRLVREELLARGWSPGR